MYVKILIHPECIWTNEESFGITWNVLQLKLYTKLILNTYSFLDDETSNSDNKYKDDPKYQKYFKMIKMGVPIDAIKHKMICDNLDPNIIDSKSSSNTKYIDSNSSSNTISNSIKLNIISNTNTNSNSNKCPPPPPPLAPINMLEQIKNAKKQKANKTSVVKTISKDTPLCFRPSANEIMDQLNKLKKK